MAVTVSTHSLELVSQDIANNSSVVRYLVKITTSGASHNDNNITTTYHIDGETYTKVHKLPTKTTTTVADKTVTIVHNPDGTRSVSANFSTPTGISAGTLTGSKTLTLPTIARASAIYVNTADIGSSTTITINKPQNTNFTTTIWYKASGQNDWTKIVDKTSQDSYGWTVPTEFYALIPNNPTIDCSFMAETYNGDTLVGTTTTTATFRATTPPLINSITAEDINPISVNLTGDSSKMIKYGSIVRVTVSATAQDSSTISSITINGIPVDSNNRVDFSWGSTNTFQVVVVDSRNNPATDTKTITMIDYIPLTLTANVSRNTPTDNKVNIVFSGNYWNDNFGSQSNALTTQYRYKESGGDYSDWINLSRTITDNTYSGNVQVSNIDYQKVYYFEIRSFDNITGRNVENIPVPKGQPIYYWDDDEFGVNGVLKVNNITVIPQNVKLKKFDITFDVSSASVGDFVVGNTNNTIPAITGYNVVGFVPISITYPDANYVIGINNRNNQIYAMMKLGYRGTDTALYMSGYIMYAKSELVDNTPIT